MHSHRRRIGYVGIAAFAVATLAAAGCSSSSSSSSTPTSSSSATSAAAAPSPSGSSGGLGAQSVTNYLTYTGGKAGPASSSATPVLVGFVNQQGGDFSLEEVELDDLRPGPHATIQPWLKTIKSPQNIAKTREMHWHS